MFPFYFLTLKQLGLYLLCSNHLKTLKEMDRSDRRAPEVWREDMAGFKLWLLGTCIVTYAMGYLGLLSWCGNLASRLVGEGPPSCVTLGNSPNPSTPEAPHGENV